MRIINQIRAQQISVRSHSIAPIIFLLFHLLNNSSIVDIVQDAPDYTPTVNETFSSFVCAVFSVWTVIFSDEHDNQKSTIIVEIPNASTGGV
jgi:hypothetical protein